MPAARSTSRPPRLRSTEPIGRDRISIAGAPPYWMLPSLARRVAEALRKERFIKKNSTLVLAISVVGRAKMAALNARYRGKRRPTDVLSFEQPGRARGPRGVVLLGDLVLCAPVVRAQARAAGHGVRDEAAVLLVHGVLHLLGYDHERSPREAARMAKAEGRLLGGRRQSAGLISRARVVRRA